MVVATRRFPPWSDLHPELLGLVLRRLPSLADRIRLRAVCHSWRRDALLEPLPPPLPWLALQTGTFLSIPDGEIHRMPVPDDARLFHGSVGNWLFLSHYDSGCSLINPFSRDVVQLPKVGTIWRHERANADDDHRFPIYLKLMALSSRSPDPSLDSIFAALITDNKLDTVISICQPTTATAFRVPEPYNRLFLDIAFYDGKLYGLTRSKLFLFEADSNSKEGKPTRILSMKCIVNSNSLDDPGTAAQSFANKGYLCGYWGYLVESSDRLLYVRRLLGVPPNVPADGLIRMKHARTLWFNLFEADLTMDSDCGRWKRVKRGQTLCWTHSKSLPASEHGPQEDCIYFMRDFERGNLNPDRFRDSGMFNMRNGMITPLLQETSVVPPTQGEYGLPVWFFPGEAM